MQARLPGLRRHRPSGEKQFTGREGLPYRGRNTPSERNGPSEKEGPSGEARFAGGKAVRRRGCPIEGGIPPSERNGPSKKEGPSGKARFAGGKAVRRRGGAALSREEYPRRRETGRRRKRVHRERHGLRGGGKAVRGGFGRGVVAGCQPHGPLSDPHREIVARILPPRRSWPVQGIPHPAAEHRRAILFMQRFRLLPPPIRQPCPTVPVARRRAQTTAWIMRSGTATLCGRRKKTIE